MGTPFTDVYEVALSKMRDYNLSTENMSTEALEDLLFIFLNSAIVLYDVPIHNLDYVVEEKAFVETLDRMEIEILALYIIASHVQSYVISTNHIEQIMTTKDFTMYSQANQLKAIKTLYESIKREASYLATKYSYRNIIGKK